ncbi:DUF5680 domain-containing protein, partial [Patescibacteria group bacterium]
MFCEIKYLGDNPLSVVIVMFIDYKPAWTMSYYGHLPRLDTEKEQKRIKDIIRFLNEACHKPFENFIPLVGGRFWRDGNFSYLSNFKGSFISFNGDCQVMDINIPVFEGRFHGGIVE